VHMFVRDGQSLGVLDGVSVTINCLVSPVHGEVADWATDSPAAMLKDR
jgi:hypothetical protein